MSAIMAGRRNGHTEWEPPPYEGIPDGPSGPEDLIRVFDPIQLAQTSIEARTLDLTCAAALAGQPVPDARRHLVTGVPEADMTLLSGDGGAGKSQLGLQLCVARAIGGEFLGQMVEQGVALFVSAEDEHEEIHRRLAAIYPNLAKLKDFHFVSLAGRDALLAAPSAKGGPLQPTPLYEEVRKTVARIRPTLLVLDTLADLFGGDEIKRNDARAFIGLLRRFCIEHGTTVLLLAHPSLSGLNSGTGTSGSTAWSNSVRSRLYFERVKSKNEADGEEADPDLRILSVKKANYGPIGHRIFVRWRDGKFVLDGAGDTGAAEKRADRSFLTMLAQFEREGRPVSPYTGRGYAPSAFAQHPDGRGTSKREYQTAMDRLLKAGRIKIEQAGPASRRTNRLIEVAS